MPREPSRWIWLAPVSVSLLAGWLTLNSLTPEAPSTASPAVRPPPVTTSPYPVPQVDAVAPIQPPPTF